MTNSRVQLPDACLTIATHEVDDVAYYELDGILDSTTASVLLDAVGRLAAGAVETVIVGCGRLSFIDAGGLTALLRARALAADAGAGLALAHPSGLLRRILHATALTDALPVADASRLAGLDRSAAVSHRSG